MKNFLIGKANTMYTLWSVEDASWTNEFGKLVNAKKCVYVKNISKDFSVVRKLYPNLEYDKELHGHTHYKGETKTKKVFAVDYARFAFGKYEGQLVAECENKDYVDWYFYNCTDAQRKVLMGILGKRFWSENEINLVKEFSMQYDCEYLKGKVFDCNDERIVGKLKVLQDRKPFEFGFNTFAQKTNYIYNVVIWFKDDDIELNKSRYGTTTYLKVNGKNKRASKKTVRILEYDIVKRLAYADYQYDKVGNPYVFALVPTKYEIL